MGIGACCPTVHRGAMRSSTGGACGPCLAGRIAASIRQSHTRRNKPRAQGGHVRAFMVTRRKETTLRFAGAFTDTPLARK
jgi:hypothetical protein